MFCAISGEIPQDAVVSKKTGQLFEKRIVLKYIADGGRCPLTGEDLTEQDLLEIKASKCLRPRSVAGNSIPGMIANFQAEWDEVMLETFTLKQHLDATRKELSQALYQHDAACRVIARVIKERDEARALLAARMGGGEYPVTTASSTNGQSNEPAAASTQMDMGDEGAAAAAAAAPPAVDALDEAVLKAINAKCAELSSTRKGRKAAEIVGLATKDQLTSRGMKLTSSFTPHKSDKPGVTCIAMSPAAMNGQSGDGVSHYALSGGVDKTALLVNTTSGSVEGKLTGHTKKISAVAFHPSFNEGDARSSPLYTAAADGTVKIWEASGGKSNQFKDKHTFAHHQGYDVCGLTMHPTGSYAISTSMDSSWAFLDLSEGKVLRQCHDNTSSSDSSMASGGYSCGSFHPDGLILGTGGDSNRGVVKIFDVREQTQVAMFSDHTDRINALTFSENGFILATASNDGSVKIWDLRKLKSTKTIEMADKSPATSVAFDYSASYLAIGTGNGVRVVTTGKEWADIMSFAPHSKAVTGVAWGNRMATQLVSCSMDRSIKVHDLTAE